MDLEETTTVEVTPDKAIDDSSLLDDPEEADDVSGLDDLPEFILDDEENENLRSVEKPELEFDSPQPEENTQNRSENEEDDEDDDMPIMPIVEMEDDESMGKDTAIDPLVAEEGDDLTASEGFLSAVGEVLSPSEDEATSPSDERRKEDEDSRSNKNKSDNDENCALPVIGVEDAENADSDSEVTVKNSSKSSKIVINGDKDKVQKATDQSTPTAADEAAADAKNMADVVEVMSDLVMDVEEGNTKPSPRKKVVNPPAVDEDDDIITLDSPENRATEAKGDDLSDDEEDMPMIRMKSDIFEAPNDDDDDDDDDDDSDPVDIHSMMQVEMAEDSDDDTATSSTPSKSQKKRRSFDDKLIEQNRLAEEAPSPRRTPRRAAAQAAANVIKEISNMENDDGAGPSSSDPAYRTSVLRRNSGPSLQLASSVGSSGSQNKPSASNSSNSSDGEKNRCHQCKTMSQSLIVVRQYGVDIHLCSNVCFNSFRNPDPIFRPLPCAKCGTLNRDNESGKLYFWETMNFCSDLCVGNFQLQIGASCSTCSRKTPWTCMGKYCVRFGSDVRQFCTASCLESYKKSARVCFHCQLDIKRLGNVVLANIPSKAATKEFCSQECVEMYIDQNLRQGSTPSKTTMASCDNCKQTKTVFKELVTSTSSHKTCSQACWDQVLRSQNINTATKCETCSKFINMDTISISPSYYVATEKRAHGFCSATCKNVYVLKSRQILSCTTCKVKKYNYDLIQFVTGRVTNYAVCSLNCLPKPSQYILNLKDTLNPTMTASQMSKNQRMRAAPPPNQDVVPIITSCTSVPKPPAAGNTNQNKPRVPNGTSSITNGYNSSAAIVNGDAGCDYAVTEVTDVTVRQMADDDIIEIRDDDDIIPTQGAPDSGQNQVVPEDGVPLDDDRWLDCETIVIIRPPPPVKRRNKGTMMTSVTQTEDKEIQTDSEELWAMPRVEMKLPEPEEKVRYVPVPIPYPVLMPYPCYAMSRPIPVPFPVGIPVPIPIPLDMSHFSKGGFTFNDVPLPIEAGPSSSTNPINNDADEVEMMDTSENCDVLPLSPSLYPNIFNFTNSPMSVGSPSASTTTGGTSSFSVAPGSPLGSKQRLSRADQGIRAWKIYYPDDKDPLNLPSEEFSEKLVNFVLRATKPKDRCRIEPDVLLNYVLGIQQYLKNGGRTDSIFYDSVYSPFVKAMTTYAEEEASRGRTIARVDEEHFWDSMELGTGSPGILLFTLIYHIYKHFNLKTWQEHAALEFSQIQIEERTSESGETIKYISIAGLRNVEDELIEVPERSDSELRCPVKLFEFYRTKCEATEGTLFKAMQSNMPERSVWYTTESLNQFDLYHMLVRAMMIHFESIE